MADGFSFNEEHKTNVCGTVKNSPRVISASLFFFLLFLLLGLENFPTHFPAHTSHFLPSRLGAPSWSGLLDHALAAAPAVTSSLARSCESSRSHLIKTCRASRPSKYLHRPFYEVDSPFSETAVGGNALFSSKDVLRETFDLLLEHEQQIYCKDLKHFGPGGRDFTSGEQSLKSAFICWSPQTVAFFVGGRRSFSSPQDNIEMVTTELTLATSV